jgi:hypothetical protein
MMSIPHWQLRLIEAIGSVALATLLVLLVALCSGCATFSDRIYKDQEKLLNPARLNETTAKSGRVHNAETDYSSTPAKHADRLAIVDYVDAGIGLTYAYCRRWFHVVGDTKRRRDIGEQDFYIIRDATATLLTMAGASKAALEVIGLANTTISGMAGNFDDAVLTAPAQRKVQVKVMEMLSSVAVPLRDRSATLTFLQAYTELEALADICTFGTIKDAVDDALSVTTTTVHPVSGAITSSPKVAQ